MWNLFVLNFLKEVIHIGINFPRSWKDRNLASRSGFQYPKISDENTPPGIEILRDSLFMMEERVCGLKTISKRKRNQTTGVPIHTKFADIDIIFQSRILSKVQSSACGIRAVKSPFFLYLLPLSHKSKLKRLLTVFICNSNSRTQ